MNTMASQITSLTIVYSTVYSDADQRKHQSSASPPFVRGIHWWPVNSPHKRPVTRKRFPFDDVIMSTSILPLSPLNIPSPLSISTPSKRSLSSLYSISSTSLLSTPSIISSPLSIPPSVLPNSIYTLPLGSLHSPSQLHLYSPSPFIHPFSPSIPPLSSPSLLHMYSPSLFYILSLLPLLAYPSISSLHILPLFSPNTAYTLHLAVYILIVSYPSFLPLYSPLYALYFPSIPHPPPSILSLVRPSMISPYLSSPIYTLPFPSIYTPLPLYSTFNILRPRQNGRHFADDSFKCSSLNDNVWITIKHSLKLVPKGLINNIPTLVQIMAWRRPGDKPLSEPMMVRSPTHICVRVNSTLQTMQYHRVTCQY